MLARAAIVSGCAENVRDIAAERVRNAESTAESAPNADRNARPSAAVETDGGSEE